MDRKNLSGGEILETLAGVKMPPQYKSALDAYAEQKGAGWMGKLAEDYAAGRDDRFPVHGPALRGVRNSPLWGPVFFAAARHASQEEVSEIVHEYEAQCAEIRRTADSPKG